ncbi:efflux transporter outer membrane subunit [Haloferula rosea]|uniref:Efflux transporter outer membrane subunit n=1 Tax=Haloferula rosea TaxID=490093 RepID=A0A934RGZ6_9BACT|nr:efflux transporter outer membrane subunit [Haloferula rosea]MBK1828165.1 efflux transporter outer membrane subunit [Haloferula rosea]
MLATSRIALPSAVLTLILPCCTVGPDYEDPNLVVEGEWHSSGGDSVVQDYWTERLDADQSAKRTGAELWWRKFNDSSLNKLITHARRNHPTAAAADARIREARAQRNVLASAWSPWIGTRGEIQGGENNPSTFGGTTGSSFSTNYIAGLEAGWEVDLFGGIRRGVEAADAEWEAAIEWQRDALVVLSAEVALHYVAARTLEERLARATEAVDDFRELHRVLVDRQAEGLSPEADVAESKAQLLTREARLPKLEQEMKVARIRLANSSGIYPNDLDPIMKRNRGIPVPPSKILVATPIDALRNRPDVRREERKLAAQTARIGLAESELYPILSISGGINWESTSASDLFTQANRAFGFGPKLKWRIFEGCKIKNRIAEEEAQTDIRLAAYRQQVMDAVTEIEIAMTRLDTEGRYASKQAEAANAHLKSTELTRKSYLAGLVDIRRLLNALIDYHDARDEGAAALGRRAGFAAALFKSIGGGQIPDG